MSQLVCPKCSNAMELGFVVDHTHGGSAGPEWVQEAVQSSWTDIKMSGKERHPVQTFRCVRCGYLESYAPPAAAE
jgi:predicted nucleic-acid-binding Zn-ribbon protein